MSYGAHNQLITPLSFTSVTPPLQNDHETPLQNISVFANLSSRLHAKFSPILEASNSEIGFETREPSHSTSSAADKNSCSPQELIERICYNVKACRNFLDGLRATFMGKNTPLSIDEGFKYFAAEACIDAFEIRINSTSTYASVDMTSFDDNDELTKIKAELQVELEHTHQLSEKTLEHVRGAAAPKATTTINVNVPGGGSSGGSTTAPIDEVLSKGAKWLANLVKDSPIGQMFIKVIAGAALTAMWAASVGLIAAAPFTAGITAIFGTAALAVSATVTKSFFGSLWSELKYAKPTPTLSVDINGLGQAN